MNTSQASVATSPVGAAPPARHRVALAVQLAILAALLVLIYWPILYQITHKWSNDGNWSHGWLVPVFSLYFLYIRREKLAQAPVRTSYVGLLGLVVALSAYFYFLFVWPIGYARQLTPVLAIAGIALLLCGWHVFRYVWFPVFFLVLAIPLPDWLYVEVTLPLRKLASSVASVLLAALVPGLYTDISGVVIDYSYEGRSGSLNVEEACSGMRLMMAFVTLGLAMAYVGERPLWQRLVMVIFCVPIAVLCNILRVFSTGLLHVHEYKDWSQGSAHEMLGLAMLPIALGLFCLVGYVLEHLVVEEEGEEEAT